MKNIKRKKRYSKEKHIKKDGMKILFTLISIIFYLEIILRINTKEKFFNVGLFYIFISSLVLGLSIFLIGTFFKDKVRKFFIYFSYIVIIFLFASQLVYYKIFSTFYTVYSASKGGQVTEFIKDIVYVLKVNIHWIILMFIPLIIIYIVFKENKSLNYKDNALSRVFIILTIIISIGVFHLSLNLGDKEVNSPYYMYYKSDYPVFSVNTLGLVRTMRINIQRTLFGFEPKTPDIEIPENTNNINDSEKEEAIIDKNQNDNLDPSEDTDEITYNIMDIDFDGLLSGETDERFRNIHMYISKKDPTAKNEISGKYKDYNLILITAEGFSDYAVNKEVTPTLYKMLHEGYNFTNFYNPIWGVSTSDGEYVATTGLIPKSGVWSMYKSSENSMPFAMGNQLSKLGYKTMAYHNHTYDYYERHLSHPNLGYEYKGLGSGLDVKPTWPESDLEMMELTFDEYANDIPFHAYYMTVSGHMRYSNSANYIAYKNKEYVKELDLNEGSKAYLATQIELDKAMEYLLDKLEEKGIAENTLIAISADHYPYGLDKKDIDDLRGEKVEENFELYRSSFILYSKSMKAETIERPVSSLDIIPTISNMMGLEFDSRLMMGIDMFSKTDPLVIFLNKSFITDKGRYNSVTREFIPNEGVTVPDGYVKEMLNEIEKKFYYSSEILDLDYYNKVIN
ncbi:MAG: sulfatase-like hydrolase/transferase [Clostridium sp.]|nr:sulfatase-like hydrolase/transferase [Clostridium sp.]